jgi:hypothetical protein
MFQIPISPFEHRGTLWADIRMMMEKKEWISVLARGAVSKAGM